jgi:hypothetical protein
MSAEKVEQNWLNRSDQTGVEQTKSRIKTAVAPKKDSLLSLLMPVPWRTALKRLDRAGMQGQHARERDSTGECRFA